LYNGGLRNTKLLSDGPNCKTIDIFDSAIDWITNLILYIFSFSFIFCFRSAQKTWLSSINLSFTAFLYPTLSRPVILSSGFSSYFFNKHDKRKNVCVWKAEKRRWCEDTSKTFWIKCHVVGVKSLVQRHGDNKRIWLK